MAAINQGKNQAPVETRAEGDNPERVTDAKVIRSDYDEEHPGNNKYKISCK